MLWFRLVVLILNLCAWPTEAEKEDVNRRLAQTKMLRVPYKSVGNVSIPTNVYIPATSRANRTLAPVLIMVHGGGFMLGSAKLNNLDQIDDSLERGWIVLGVEHRLCPGVNILEGPMTDVRDVLTWTQSGGLRDALAKANETIRPDTERVVAMGVSAGGHLVLSLVSVSIHVQPLLQKVSKHRLDPAHALPCF